MDPDPDPGPSKTRLCIAFSIYKELNTVNFLIVLHLQSDTTDLYLGKIRTDPFIFVQICHLESNPTSAGSFNAEPYGFESEKIALWNIFHSIRRYIVTLCGQGTIWEMSYIFFYILLQKVTITDGTFVRNSSRSIFAIFSYKYNTIGHEDNSLI